jgi:hypothetical protein
MTFALETDRIGSIFRRPCTPKWLEGRGAACFKGTRKCGIGRDRNFFRKFSACTNICPTPGGKYLGAMNMNTLLIIDFDDFKALAKN